MLAITLIILICVISIIVILILFILYKTLSSFNVLIKNFIKGIKQPIPDPIDPKPDHKPEENQDPSNFTIDPTANINEYQIRCWSPFLLYAIECKSMTM